MTLVDQFESMFRSADRPRYQYERIEIKRVLVVTDLDAAEADEFTRLVKHYLQELGKGVWYQTLQNDDYQDVDELLEAVKEAHPDLIVSYRNVRYTTWRWPYSIGVYLNVLTRETDYPVLVLPNPHELPDKAWAKRQTDDVMVLADHLTGDDRLVHYGARFVRPGGKLHLAHVEDDSVFDRYIDIIGKLPSIDTGMARDDIRERLLKEPLDYIESCRQALADESEFDQEVVSVVTMGHTLEDYGKLIEDHSVDLLVFHAKDNGDLALHGKAYSLAVRLRKIPLLML